MTIALVTKFDGGISFDPRTRNQDQSQDSQGFDIFTNPHKLIPFGDSIADTITGLNVSDIHPQRTVITALGLTTVGYKSSSDARGTCYNKTNINDVWGANGDGAVGYTLVPDSNIVFRGKQYFLGQNGSYVKLQRCDGGMSVVDCGNMAGTTAIRPFIHPKNNLLTIICGQNVYVYDGTTITTCGLTIPTGYTATSMTDYGDNIAISMNENYGNGQAVIGIWSLNTANLEFDIIVPFGEGQIIVIQNLYNTLYGVMLNNSYGQSQLNARLKIKSYAGGSVDMVVNIPIAGNQSGFLQGYTFNNNRLYFALNNDSAVYAFGKNQEGQLILTHDRFINNGAVTQNVASVSFVGDVMWCAFSALGGTFTWMRSMINGLGETASYNNVNFYLTTINPVMGLSRYTLQDVHKSKQFPAFLLEYTGSANGSTQLQYSVDGSTLANVINDTNATGERATESGNEITSGSPTVEGREITLKILCSGGSQPKQIAYEYTPIPTML